MKHTTIALLASALLAGAARAEIRCQLGILTPETLAGNNPATGAPWKAGDQYRFVFHTSADTTAESSDIATYNDWVQGLANASAVYGIGAGDGVTWKAIGSTNEVDARDNTSTNPEQDGTGHPIFLLDGSTVVANDYADLWDGSIQHVINLTEQGGERAYWPFTGTYTDGTKAPGHGSSFAALGGGAQIQQGFAGNATQWVWRTWTGDPPATQLPMYALSDPLTIVDSTSIRLTIDPAETAGYDLSWNSRQGLLYNLRGSPDLTGDPATWALVQGDIPATPPLNQLTVEPSGPTRFYRVEEFRPPPLLAEDFEDDDGGFAASKTEGTDWARGEPDSVGEFGGSVTSGNAGSANCWGTNLGDFSGPTTDRGFYVDPTTDSCLGSPVIDLTNVAGAELSFAQALDFPPEDGATVRIIDLATGDPVAAGPFPLSVADDDNTTASWRTAGPYPLPVGGRIRIEWCFSGNGGQYDDYLGWYIDDVVVRQTTQ